MFEKFYSRLYASEADKLNYSFFSKIKLNKITSDQVEEVDVPSMPSKLITMLTLEWQSQQITGQLLFTPWMEAIRKGNHRAVQTSPDRQTAVRGLINEESNPILQKCGRSYVRYLGYLNTGKNIPLFVIIQLLK